MIVIRIILLLLPLIGVLYYLRWRYKLKLSGENASDEDLQQIRKVLTTIVVALILLGLSLRFFDTTNSDKNKIYVPPHVVDGKVIPGKFVDPEEVEKPKEKPKPDNQE